MPHPLIMRHTFFCLALLCSSAARAAAEPAILNDIEVMARQVTLKLSRPTAFKVSFAPKPPAVVVTLEDARVSDLARDKSSVSAWVAGIAAIPLSDAAGESARVVIKLGKTRDFTPEWRGNDLVVLLTEAGSREPVAAPAQPKPPAAPVPPQEDAPKAPPPAPSDQTAPSPAAPTKPASAGAAKYRAQAGSFASEDAAKKLTQELEAKISPVEVRKVEVGGKTAYQVDWEQTAT
jgi:hypothetical protein